MNKKIQYYNFIILIICLFFMSACNTMENKSINSKEQITNLIQDKKYKEIHEFINNNNKNDNKKPLVDFAIYSLSQTNDVQNDSFLKDMYKKLITDQDWDTATSLISGVENDKNSYTVNRFKGEIESYQSERELIEELKKEMNQLIEQKEDLIKQYPYNIPLDYTIIHDFPGVILQKISENEYRVIQRYTNSNKEYVLKTVKTTFTSAGQFSMYVIPGEERTYGLDNGFSKVFQVLYEIPAENVDTIIEINNVGNQINHLSKEIKEYEELKEYHIDIMNMTIEDIFKMKNAQEKIRNTEKEISESENEIVYVKDNKFYIYGLTLEDDKQTLISILGEPNSEEVDEAGLFDLILNYDKMTAFINNDKIFWINIDIDEELIEELIKSYSGERYVGQSGEIFFYENQTEHLLMIAENYDGGYEASLAYVDGNFTWNVENGYYQRMED